MNAIAILSLRPKSELVDFYSKTGRDDDYDVFYFVDDNDFQVPTDHRIKFVQLDDTVCGDSGFNRFNRLSKAPGLRVSAWDKALLYFCRLNTVYENVWFLEDDVFVPRTTLIGEIDAANLGADLLSSKSWIVESREADVWAHARSITPALSLPCARGMVCAMRASAKLLQLVEQFACRHPKVDKFIEYIFHTLALHNNLSVKCVDALKGIVFRHDWQAHQLNANTMYHPVKSIQKQEEFRAHLANVSNRDC
jgi:hypothetical protein